MTLMPGLSLHAKWQPVVEPPPRYGQQPPPHRMLVADRPLDEPLDTLPPIHWPDEEGDATTSLVQVSEDTTAFLLRQGTDKRR